VPRRYFVVLAIGALLSGIPAVGASGPDCFAVDAVEGCTYEYNQENGSCETRDEHRTEVWIRMLDGELIHFTGWEYCQPSTLGNGTYTNTGMEVRSPIGLIVWRDGESPSFSSCNIWYFGVTTVRQACLVPPPNPGWGHMIPYGVLP